ncbi:MAG: outer membrane protein assembly factor BamD [Planctomycetota bacterium]
MPETGEVRLEELPRGERPERLRHAMALIGAGQLPGGIAELRALLEENPEAEWAASARLVLARGYLAQPDYRKAFEQATRARESGADTPAARRARELQRKTASLQAKESIGRAREMFDRMLQMAESYEEEAELQKEKADAVFAAGRYLEAQDQYMVLASRYSRSAWVPYAWYRIADCEFELARWLDLGTQRLREAIRAYADFAEVYPDHGKVDEAKVKMKEARERLADKYRQIAEFYIRAEERPWAAVHYLEYLAQEFAETPEGEWASQKLERIREQSEVPLRGERRTLPAPGIGVAGPKD